MAEKLSLRSEDSHWPCFTSDCSIVLLCFLMKVHILAGAPAESPQVFLYLLQKKGLSLFCMISLTQSVNLYCRQHCGSSCSDLSLHRISTCLCGGTCCTSGSGLLAPCRGPVKLGKQGVCFSGIPCPVAQAKTAQAPRRRLTGEVPVGTREQPLLCRRTGSAARQRQSSVRGADLRPDPAPALGG